MGKSEGVETLRQSISEPAKKKNREKISAKGLLEISVREACGDVSEVRNLVAKNDKCSAKTRDLAIAYLDLILSCGIPEMGASAFSITIHDDAGMRAALARASRSRNAAVRDIRSRYSKWYVSRLVNGFRSQIFNDPRAELMWMVIEQAIFDACVPSISVARRDKDSAIRYLAGDMPHAHYCGIDPDYVRRTLRDSGLLAWGQGNG